MSNVTQFFPGGGTGATTFNRRQIYYGPTSATFSAATSGAIEVNVWGGGGNGGNGYATGGGGGGGYVRYVYDLSAGDQLSVTVGGPGGTSSVSCPSQSPTSPISATGGGTGGIPGPSPYPPGNPPAGSAGTGGSGTGSVPTARSGILFTASGGAGSIGKSWTGPYMVYYGGGGGSAGSEYGDGVSNTSDINGGFMGPSPHTSGGAGNEVASGGAGLGGKGGGENVKYVDPRPEPPSPGNPGGVLYRTSTSGPGNYQTNLGAPTTADFNPWNSWFFSYEQEGGPGGLPALYHPNPNGLTVLEVARDGGLFAGGAGGSRPGPGYPGGYNSLINQASNGGYAGGGGGAGQPHPGNPFLETTHGIGGAGLVIIYFTI